MPSFRVLVDVLGVRPGLDPAQVIPLAERLLAHTHRVEDRKLLLVGSTPRIQLRFLVPSSHDAAEDADALATGGELVAQLAPHITCGAWVVRRRDGRAQGGWPVIGGGDARAG